MKLKKICPKCGHELKNEKFCPECGQSTASVVPFTPEGKICPNCGQKINNEKFCPTCGQKLEKEENTEYSAPKKYCRNCGSQIDEKAEICPNCGVRQLPATTEKSPVSSLILSFLFPGIGQFYNNQPKKGVYLIVGYIISIFLVFLIIGFILVPLIWIYGMYDAYTSAQSINNGEQLEDKLF